MRDEWSEEEVLLLASEESDRFDRKSGQMLQKSQDDFFNALAKATSAFANSGGGVLVVGAEDDGTLTGLPPFVGKTSTKDWIEQKIPHLVSYPLVLFRVHTVVPANPSIITQGNVVVVVEIGDSPAAPHQSVRDKKYYHRAGGRSEPAQHFYLELLRQRLTNAVLKLEVDKLQPIHAQEYDGRILLEVDLKCNVNNVGKVAAYKWALATRTHDHLTRDGEMGSTLFLHHSSFPKTRMRSSDIRLDDTILPSLYMTESIHLAFVLSPVDSSTGAIESAIKEAIGNMSLGLQLITETAVGDVQNITFRDHLDVEAFVLFLCDAGLPPTGST